MYNVSEEVIKLIPKDIAEKHWVLPVDNQGDVLTVVMIDPLDTDAIKELEEITGFKIVPFVGMISEILSSLQTHYKLFSKDAKAKMPGFLIETKTYVGTERRASIRYRSKVNIQFPIDGRYIKAKTIDVSRYGFGFMADESLEIGTMLTMEIDLPQRVHPLPIAAVTQVVRCIPRQKDSFEIGVKTVKISKHDVGVIMSYVMEHAE